VRHRGHTRNITQCIRTIGESLRSSDNRGGGEQELFWQQQQERTIYNAVEIVKRGTGDVYDELFGNSKVTASLSEHYEGVLQEKVFLNGLRTAGRANGFVCDAIVIKSGEPFSSGENWPWKSFSQE